MNIRTYITPALLAGAALLSASAQAAQVDGQVAVTLTLNGTCTTNVNGGTVAFGTHPGTNGNTPLTATNNFTVNCSNGLPYDIEIGPGTTAGTTVGARKMDDGAGNLVNYELRRTSDSGPIWGDGTMGTTYESSTGIGADQPYTIYGVVPQQPSPPNGTYTDTVTVTVIW